MDCLSILLRTLNMLVEMREFAFILRGCIYRPMAVRCCSALIEHKICRVNNKKSNTWNTMDNIQ